MSEHPTDALARIKRDIEWALLCTHDSVMERKYVAQLEALRAVEQLVEEARQLDKWHPQTRAGLAGLHPQHAGCVEAFRAALALFDRKEQT